MFLHDVRVAHGTHGDVRPVANVVARACSGTPIVASGSSGAASCTASGVPRELIDELDLRRAHARLQYELNLLAATSSGAAAASLHAAGGHDGHAPAVGLLALAAADARRPGTRAAGLAAADIGRLLAFPPGPVSGYDVSAWAAVPGFGQERKRAAAEASAERSGTASPPPAAANPAAKRARPATIVRTTYRSAR